MTRRRWLALAAVVLLAGAGAFVVAWMLRVREANEPQAPVAYVSASWQQYRLAPGHQIHVTQQKLACTECHTEEKGGVDHPAPTVCARCHEQRAKIQHGLGLTNADANAPAPVHGGLSKCVDCHGFGPEPDKKPSDCLRCHQSPQGAVHAVATHATVACTNCHDVHENAIEPKACTDCHSMSLKHGRAGTDVASQCRVCHEVHGKAETALDQCISCHTAPAQHAIPRTAVFADGHTCGSCHAPHDFTANRTQTCSSCHEGVHPLQGHERSACTSCHNPHAVRDKLQNGAICVTCHKDVALVHTGPKAMPAGGACLGCHAAHPAKADQGPAPCTSCHQDIGGSSHTAHAKQLTCTGCHTPHGFQLEMDLPLCAKCHAAKVSAVKKQDGHDTCTSCHREMPHGIDVAPQPCGACHTEIKSKVSEGHAVCTKCHEPHLATAELPSCAKCHQKEAKFHPKGHDNCVQCHEQHSGKQKPGVSDCTTCHERSSLAGLHNEPKHLENGCVQCHAAHGTEAPGKRQMCVGCHEEQVDHQPDAKRCDGCHAFIGSPPPRGIP